MRLVTVLSTFVLCGLGVGAIGGAGLSSAWADSGPAPQASSAGEGSATASPSSPASSASTSAGLSASPTVSASPTPGLRASSSAGSAGGHGTTLLDASPAESASISPSASPFTSAASKWQLSLTVPDVTALRWMRITGTSKAATGDPSRPTWATVERLTSHTWKLVHHVRLAWSGDVATYALTLKDTSRPGTYTFRARLTTSTGVTVTESDSASVRAALNFTVSGPLHSQDLPHTYRAGCPVGPAHLRKITMTYWSFKTGTVALGTLIARDYVVSDLRRVFTKMFKAKFPIHKMIPVDHYHGYDVRAMAYDDTSAFNCRSVTGNPYRVSQHSYGNAIDINTWENPYVTSGHVYPSHHFLRRSSYHKGMILKNRVVQRAFAAEGWLWGARWGRPDYQHFSSNGG